MAKKVYKQNPARYRMEDQLVVGTPFASHDAIVNSQPVGTPYTPGSPTAAGLYNVTFKNTQPLNKNQRTTSPWYGYMDLGVDVFDRREFDNVKNRNVVPSFEPWKRQIQPNLTLGIEHTNKFNPRVDPYKRLTTKNSSMGAGLTVGAYEGGSGLSVFAKPEIDYRIPFSHSGSSSGSSSREKLYGPLGRYEDKKRISIPSPVGMDIYGNLDAAYLVPANWTNDDSIYRQLRVSSQTPNNFNMGRNRVGANIGARAQWKDNTSANLNVGAYYNPYNPGSKIVPRVELGVSHRFKDGGWLSKYQDGSKVVPVQMPDGKIQMMSQEEVDALYNEGHISDRGPNGEMIYKNLPEVTIRPSGPKINVPDADNTRTVINTPNGPVTTGQYGSYRKPMGHTWKDVMYDLAIPGAVLAAPIAAEGSAIAGLDYLGELAAPYVAPIVEGLGTQITSAIPGLTYGNALALAGAYGGAEAGTEIPGNLREGEYMDAIANAAEFGLGYALPMYEFAAPSVANGYRALKNAYKEASGLEEPIRALPTMYTSEEMEEAIRSTLDNLNNLRNNPNFLRALQNDEQKLLKLNPPTQATIDEVRRAAATNSRILTRQDRAILDMYGIGNPADYSRAPRTFDYNTTAQYWNNLQNRPLEQPSFATHPYRDAFGIDYPEHSTGMQGMVRAAPYVPDINDFTEQVGNWAGLHGFTLDDLPADYLTRFSHMAEPYGITASDLTDANFSTDAINKINNLSPSDRQALLSRIVNTIHIPLSSTERAALFSTPSSTISRNTSFDIPAHFGPARNAILNAYRGLYGTSSNFGNVTESEIVEKLNDLKIPKEDIDFFKKIDTNQPKTSGHYSYLDSDSPIDHVLLNPSVLYKTEEVAPNIERLEKIKASLANNTDAVSVKIRQSVDTRLEDLYSTEWLRSEERMAELKERGLNPSMELSVVTSPSGTKYLVDKDGNVLGNITGVPKRGNPNLSSSALRLKFQGLNGKELLKQGFTEEEVGDMVINHLGTQNKLGEALYRGVSHGVNAVRGEGLNSGGSFALTKLKNVATGTEEEARRAERFWQKLVKLGYATFDGNVYRIVKGVLPAALGKLYIDTYSNDEETKKLKYGGTWLNQYGSGTSNVQPTLTFNTRPVGAVNVGTAADNTSVVVNTPKGPVVTGYRKDATPDPTITKKVQDAQAVSRPAAAEATTSEANLLNPIITLGKGILDANDYLGRSIDESLPIALSRRYLDKTFNVPQKYRNRGGVSIYDNNETFKDAWEDARKKGQAIFWWKNPETGEYEKKSTKSELSEEDQLNKYGITDSQIEYFRTRPTTREMGRRLRTNIYPFGYDVVNENGKRSLYGKVFNGLFLDKPVLNADQVFLYGDKGMPTNEQVRKELEREENDDAMGPFARNRMDAIRMYTGVPQKHNTFSISKYKFDPIEKAKGPQTYYSINMDNDTKQQMINAIYKVHGQENPFFRKDAHFEGASANPVYDSFMYVDGPGDYNKPYRDVDPNSVMGNYQLRRGKDDRGDYVSYYDYWDLDPIDLESKTGFTPPQPGKPFHIHDRIYVNNYGTAEEPDYKPMYFNDTELRNLENSIGNYSWSNFEEKKKPSNYNDIAQELLNRGYLSPDYNTNKVLYPDSDFAVYGAYMDWLKANSQKKKLGGWLNQYK